MAAAAHFDGVCIGITLHCLGEAVKYPMMLLRAYREVLRSIRRAGRGDAR